LQAEPPQEGGAVPLAAVALVVPSPSGRHVVDLLFSTSTLRSSFFTPAMVMTPQLAQLAQ